MTPVSCSKFRPFSFRIAFGILASGVVLNCSGGSSGDGDPGGSGSGSTSASGGSGSGASSGGSSGGGGGLSGSGSSGSAGGITSDSVPVDRALRYQVVRLRALGANSCATSEQGKIVASECGGDGQSFRIQVLGSEYLSIVENESGTCWSASGDGVVLAECTNAPEQQFAYLGSASAGYTLTSVSEKKPIGASLGLGADAGTFEIDVKEAADPLAVVVDERAIGWATMSADIIVPDATPPSGDEATRKAMGTTGGGSWEAAKAKSFSNVVWFKPTDFSDGARAASLTTLKNAIAGSEPRIVLFEEGEYDFSLETPLSQTSCQASCSNGSKYTQVGGFCNCSSTSCTSGGYEEKTRTLDFGSNKTLLGLGGGATFKHLMTRTIRNGNLILRNLAFRELPGDVRAWDDALLFYPADHVWVDHVSFSGFGRGSVVLSGTRVDDGDSFYAYRDSGWMTFSWVAIDSSEDWRCGGSEDSPYPFFTTNDPGLTFSHVHFKRGHGRNPAIDGEGAHFINSAWENVSDGLDGRGSAKLRVEGCYFDGKVPIRMDDPKPPTVYAPWNATLLDDERLQVIFAANAWSSIQSDWGKRGLDIATLDTNSVPVAPYPYDLDPDPTKVLETVKAGAGIGKGDFPSCTVNAGDESDYACE